MRRALSSDTGGRGPGLGVTTDQGPSYDVTSVDVQAFVNGPQSLMNSPVVGSRLHVLNKQDKNMIKRFRKWEVKGK